MTYSRSISSLRQEPLHALAGLADEDPPRDRLVLARVLADDQDPRRAVEPAAVEDRPPLDAEVGGRIDVALRCLSHERGERLGDGSGVEVGHPKIGPTWGYCRSARRAAPRASAGCPGDRREARVEQHRLAPGDQRLEALVLVGRRRAPAPSRRDRRGCRRRSSPSRPTTGRRRRCSRTRRGWAGARRRRGRRGGPPPGARACRRAPRSPPRRG